jgi:serine/threonine protein kinase, bacterial
MSGISGSTPALVLMKRYQIMHELGRGAMGTVFLARDSVDNELKAVKEFRPSCASPRERIQFEKLFKREATILRSLRHSNLPSVSDFFEEGGRLYLVMEYVEGRSLLQILESLGTGLPEDKVLLWAITIAEVLRYLHNQYPPIIFRDVKPANIIEKPDKTLKLVDFGIARYYEPCKTSDTLNLGSPGYAAPEQYYGKGQSLPQSDIYGLGVTMHVLLTNRDPMETPFQFPDILSINNSISRNTARIISQAIMADPLFRFLSAADMLYALKAAHKSLAGGRIMQSAIPAVAARFNPPAPHSLKSQAPQSIPVPTPLPLSQIWQNRTSFALQHPFQILRSMGPNISRLMVVSGLTFVLFLPTIFSLNKWGYNVAGPLLLLALGSLFLGVIAFFTT